MPIRSIPLVGIDVGGTFTDFVALIDDEVKIHKVSTTPDDQSRAIVAGLQALGIEEAEIIHGMTVATNALLERRGAKTALLTTAGFADVLVIGRQNRPHLYRLSQERPPALVADGLRLEVAERIDPTGAVLQPLDETEVSQLEERLRSEAVESLAIVFLFSFRNPMHEIRAAALLQAALPDLPISLSSEILPEYREYERTTTTVINAYVQPLVSRYLARLQQALAPKDERQASPDDQPSATPDALKVRPSSTIRIMQSNGGAIGLDQAAGQAARLVLSGPAGGVVGAFEVARQASVEPRDRPHLITFDMGGTSTDVALCPGQVPTTAESTIAGLPLRLPVIDIHTVGAGGGSIAFVDAGGGLRVGPRSAGALPGPVCYGRGGVEPTVTDANLLLGRLDPAGFLGGQGEVALDKSAAQRVIAALGAKLGLSAEEAALGVVRVVNAVMERALRRVSVERGYDPRDFTLLPFGGAGPLHACELADTLSIRRILVPRFPGVLSAYGMLVADIVSDASHSILRSAEELLADLAPLQQVQTTLAGRVRSVLRQERVIEAQMSALLDLRYHGQGYELTVNLALPLNEGSLRQAVADFHRLHEQRYGYASPQERVQVVTMRMRGHGPGANPALPRQPLGAADATAARLADKPIWFAAGGPTITACYDRGRLQAGQRLAGPAIVFQFDATTLISPGWTASLDEFQNLWLQKVGDTDRDI